ncbi:MAG: conjugal transfer protein TrbI [Planctomycetaceae bacterium TMED241]|uniref:conjugal transfer protein TrbI n=1 Tax=Synechococcus sp. KORDI-49 TaxID=585423 RepID=UPI0008FF98DB|nr:conjugal transfer protein TrbI [Synechococcus sp. KORDI-49]MBL6738829.1 conjugal transfer protein TrbI [Synechococcus sp. BS301-5m-G54]MBL6795565.1 conjugal transfer protein TrbI [Synechococcus sp. BS307-5m-G34]RPG08871.1 MAG: conjugal transfer protein TrbI [Planctomycetaceae bacterium TMED241]RPG11997.1 MAG: conjugal transfer protein TrbI [Planctomycetaceae bacterium TMED241]
MTTTSPCACLKCTCQVEEAKAVVVGGKVFCSEACSTGHLNHEPCHGAGSCGCSCGD